MAAVSKKIFSLSFIPLKTRGIVCIISAAFFFALMALFVRLSGALPVMQKALVRNIITALVAFWIMVRQGEHTLFVPSVSRDWVGLTMRTVFGTLGLVCNFWAVDNMPLADANMLNKMAPFFAILMSVFIVHERPKRIDLLCVAGAFIGSVFVLKPGAGIASYPAVIALAGGFCAGAAYAYIRQMGMHKVPGSVIIFFFSLFSSLACTPFVLLDYAPMSGIQWCYLLLAGLAAAGGQISVTAAYGCAPAKEISVFDYSQVLFAALFGICFFSEVPDFLSLIGYATIIGMAILRWRINLRLAEKETVPGDISSAETP